MVLNNASNRPEVWQFEDEHSDTVSLQAWGQEISENRHRKNVFLKNIFIKLLDSCLLQEAINLH